MAVEVKVSKKIPAPIVSKYPYIGIATDGSGDAILFTKVCTGFWLGRNLFELGHYFEQWSEDEFTPLSPSESITLRNV